VHIAPKYIRFIQTELFRKYITMTPPFTKTIKKGKSGALIKRKENVSPSPSYPDVVYNEDHFSNNIPTWERYMLPHLLRCREEGDGGETQPQTQKRQGGERGGRGGRVLVLGASEGLAAVWLARKAFLPDTTKSSITTHVWTVTCDDDRMFTRLRQNVRGYGKTVRAIHAKSVPDVLMGDDKYKKHEFPSDGFDVIYIDVGHTSKANLEAAVLSFPLLKPGGIVFVNNYTHDSQHTHSCPRPGIDAFVDCFSHHLKVVYTGWEMVFLKRRRPLKHSRCTSEYYNDAE